MKKHFIINEASGEYSNIGTVEAENDSELNAKIEEACFAHFGDVTKVLSPVHIEDVTRGRVVETSVEVEDSGTQRIEILETWLY